MIIHFLFLFLAPLLCSAEPARPKILKRVVGFYDSTNYGISCQGHASIEPDNIPGNAFTHINFKYSTIHPETYQIVPRAGIPPMLFTRTTDLKRTYPGIKVYISVGGNEHEDDTTSTAMFEEVASTADKRQIFIQQTLRFLQRYGFDGIDLNWESLTPTHSENFSTLVAELRQAFKRQTGRYGLSITVPAKFSSYPINQVYPQLDFVNLMAYDFHSASLNHKTPLLQPHSSTKMVESSLKALEGVTETLEKFNLMLTFDSRSFQATERDCQSVECTFKGPGPKRPCSSAPGVLNYKDLIEYLANDQTTISFDDTTSMNYAMSTDSVWISFDDNRTWRKKMELAQEAGFGGIAIENIESDTASWEALDSLLFNRPAEYQDAMFVPSGTKYEPFGGSKHKRTLKRRAEIGPLVDVEPGTIYSMFHDRDGPQSDFLGASGGQGCVKKAECDLETEIIMTEGCTGKVCCPLWAAPDPDTCVWRDDKHANDCAGTCRSNEVVVAEDSCGDIHNKDENKRCSRGVKAFCCPVAYIKLKDQCEWTECEDDGFSCDRPLTHPGWKSVAKSLADGKCRRFWRADQYKQLCCPPKSVWQGCHWVGKGQCAENRCGPDDVQLARDRYGDNDNKCGTSRFKALCCRPLYGMNPFAPAAMSDLFPKDVTDRNEQKFDWRLSLDHSAHVEIDGEDIPQTDTHTPDPEKTTFGFFAIIGDPDQVSTIDKRDGSEYEVFDCPTEEADAIHVSEVRKLRAVCLGDPSSCEEIFFGGIEGKLIRLPEHCTTNTYVRAINFTRSANQQLPHQLEKRTANHITQPEVMDMRFDYNFRLAKRAEGVTYRIDYSNQPGYWADFVGLSKQPEANHDLHDAIYDLSAKETILDKIKTFLNKATWSHVYKDASSFVFDEVLGDVSKECVGERTSVTASIYAEARGSITSKLAFGISIMGGLVNDDGARSFGFVKFRDLDVDIRTELIASAHWEGVTEDIELAYAALFPPFKQRGLFDLGPYAAISARLGGSVDIDAGVKGYASAIIDELSFSLPGTDSSANSEAARSKYGTVEANSAVETEFQVAGSLAVTLAARFGFRIGIESFSGKGVHAGVEAVVEATSMNSLSAHAGGVGEDGECRGGVLSSSMSLLGYCIIKGDFVNWERTALNVTFLPYQIISEALPICLLSENNERRSLDVEYDTAKKLNIRAPGLPNRDRGKMFDDMVGCLDCKDVDAESHRCLIKDANGQFVRTTEPNVQRYCQVLKYRKTRGGGTTAPDCNEIPYLETDPPYLFWDGTREDPTNEKSDKLDGLVDAPEDEAEDGPPEDPEPDAADDGADDGSRGNTGAIVIPGSDLFTGSSGIEKRAPKVHKFCSHTNPLTTNPRGAITAKRLVYPRGNDIRALQYGGDQKGWTWTEGRAECGKSDVQEGKLISTEAQVEHVFESQLLTEFFSDYLVNRLGQLSCWDLKLILGQRYKGPNDEDRERQSPIIDRLYAEFPGKEQHQDEFALLHKILNPVKARILNKNELFKTEKLMNLYPVQRNLQNVRDVISVFKYLQDKNVWEKFLKTAQRIYAELIQLERPDNFNGLLYVTVKWDTRSNVWTRHELYKQQMVWHEKWKDFLGLVYWRAIKKAQKYCKEALDEIKSIADSAPDRGSDEIARQTALLQAVAELREEAGKLRLPKIVPGTDPISIHHPSPDDLVRWPGI